jgi:hypothetical protein
MKKQRRKQRRESLGSMAGRVLGVDIKHGSKTIKAKVPPTKKSAPLMIECDECRGCGEVQAACAVCGKSLTETNVEPGTDDWCRTCAKGAASA